jgi:hypothetical protein
MRRAAVPGLFGLLGLAVAQNTPLYDFSSSPLVQLDDSNFDDLVIKDDKHLWVVEFYADWCAFACVGSAACHLPWPSG